MIFYVSSFFLSVLVEFFVFYNLFKVKRIYLNKLNLFYVVFLLNAFTQPLFHFIIPFFINLNYLVYLICIEILIFIVEAYLLYRVYLNSKLSLKYFILFSFIANFISWNLTVFLLGIFF